MDRRAFGQRIKKIRNEQKITAEKLSGLCEVNAVFIRQIETGRKLPSLQVFIKICNALHTSPAYFLSEELKFEEENGLEILLSQKKELTPKQLQIVDQVVSVVVEYMLEQ